MIKVEVTQEDIEKGKKRDSSCCPVALACKRVVNLTWSEVFQRVGYNYDRIISRWIGKFDRGEKVEPFSFELPNDIK